jgi:hypothetical protein
LQHGFLELLFDAVAQKLDAGGLASGQERALVEGEGLVKLVLFQGFLQL